MQIPLIVDDGTGDSVVRLLASPRGVVTTILDSPEARISIEELGEGRRRVSAEFGQGRVVSTRACETAYPIDLIEHVLRVKGPPALCDELRRDESPNYIQHHFGWDIFSYVDKENLAGARFLDFGSGCGASSMVLARQLPDSAQIVGVELLPEYVELARHRAEHYHLQERVKFHLNLDGASLPSQLGTFDCILLSAVFEHLLPGERQTVLPMLWSALKVGGTMFMDQTPYRWSPMEQHTTGLPLLNYLPDNLAHFYARHFSKRVRCDEAWPTLLRRGIRGGSPGAIMRILNQQGRKAELLEPSYLGVKDRIELWYQLSSAQRGRWLKKMMLRGLKAVKAVTGITMVPSLSIAIRKIA